MMIEYQDREGINEQNMVLRTLEGLINDQATLNTGSNFNTAGSMHIKSFNDNSRLNALRPKKNASLDRMTGTRDQRSFATNTYGSKQTGTVGLNTFANKVCKPNNLISGEYAF